jgi:surfactin synthase thioesterase subunit
MALCKWVCKADGRSTTTTLTTQRPRLRIFCFPPLGTGAQIFHSWSQHLPSDVEVMPIEYPGRNIRMSEPLQTDLVAMAKQCATDLLPLFTEVPFVLFGHSMGAWVAYEVGQELRRKQEEVDRSGANYCLLPRKIYVSCRRTPHLFAPEHDTDQITFHLLSACEFWEQFEKRYGHNPIFDLKQVRDFMYPIFCADFRALETYTAPENQIPLPFPLCAIAAVDDDRFNAEGTAQWAKHTIAVDFFFSEKHFSGGLN